MTSFVESPAGVRLAVGLLAPYLTPAGQAEVAARWGAPADVLFAEAVEWTARLRDFPAVHAALGVWLRDHTLPADAAAALSAFTETIPDDPATAQAVLDGWAAKNTMDMIQQFPATVTESTRALLASAVAMDDKWACPADETVLRFTGTQKTGFAATVVDAAARSTSDQRSVHAVLGLQSGVEMRFVVSEDGHETGLELLDHPDRFTGPVQAGQRFVGTCPVSYETTDVSVVLPEFTTRSMHDLARDADRWGLVEALKPSGVPGLGDLEVSEAKQDAFIEVTKDGVRAAAVTAFSLRAAAMWTPPPFTQRQVRFEEGFAYEIRVPGLDVAFFRGVYTG